jgi:hypothetical protein
MEQNQGCPPLLESPMYPSRGWRRDSLFYSGTVPDRLRREEKRSGSRAAFLVVEREKGTCPVECTEGELVVEKERENRKFVTLPATDVYRGLAIRELEEVII